MVNKTCPHLGRRDDPSTLFNYPSVGNFCHHARPLAPPNEEHQFEYCLSGRHRECPVYQAAVGKRLPPSVKVTDWIDPASLPASFFQRFSLWQLGVILFLGVTILVGIVFVVLASNWGFLITPALPDATSTLIPTRVVSSPTLSPFVGTEAFPTLTETPLSPEFTPSPSPTETPSATPTLTITSPFTPVPPTPTQVCTLPPGWAIYTVRSGDTLSTISAATGATVSQLQQANCLGTSTQIFTGQNLFVPKLPDIPTATIPPSASPTPALPGGTLSPSHTPTLTPIPPTSTPLTPSPTNTSIPPTETPTPSPTPLDTPTKTDESTQPPTTNTPTPGI